MATVTLLQPSIAITSTAGLQFGVLEDQGNVVSHTSKKLVVAVFEGAVTLQGTGFGDFDGTGWPLTGTIEKITISRGGEDILRIAGLSIDMGLWRSLSENHDGPGFASAILGGDDILLGGDLVQTYFGHAGDDAISTFADDDFLNGGAGRDILTGGQGKDRFAFSAATDSSAVRPDLITDLANKDKIDLKAIDADRTTAGNQAFVLVQDFSDAAGELIAVYDSSADVTRFHGDTDGDGLANLTIEANGFHADYVNFVL